MPLLQRVGDHTKCPLPRTVEELEGTLHSLPVWQVEEAICNGFTVPSLQNMLRWQDKALHFQKILQVWRKEIQDKTINDMKYMCTCLQSSKDNILVKCEVL